MSISRKHEISQRGSPSYTLYPGAITAGETTYYDLEQESDSNLAGCSNYLPMDFVHVINNDVVDIEVILNGTKHFYYPAGLAQSITDVNVYSIAVKNMDSSVDTTANKISITLRRKPEDVDKVARGLSGLIQRFAGV